MTEISTRLLALFSRIYSGESQLFAESTTWQGAHGFGDITFLCDGWKLTIFQDCGDADYLDSCCTSEGECYSFDDLATCKYDTEGNTVSEDDWNAYDVVRLASFPPLEPILERAVLAHS